jgi:CTP synthase
MSASKYIFVTGGVVSGLGKGITAASIGLILKSNGLKVDAIKFDPYLNVDPGTMSPYEHGEVFVLNDGTECDLDLGHYERFLDTDLTSHSSVTAGKIYSHILEQERQGVFLGKNVQLIPNVTNFIKLCFEDKMEGIDVRIIEIGGTSGDMEGDIFLESIRQFERSQPESVLHVHLGYIPFLGCSGEYKTKPFQTSLRELLRKGLQPNILVARYEEGEQHDLDKTQLDKLALFGNVNEDLPSIYAVPSHLCQTKIVERLSSFLDKKLHTKLPTFFEYKGKVESPKQIVKVAVVGKYGSKLGDADYSILQSTAIAGFHANVKVENIIIAAEELASNQEDAWEKVKSADCILVLGGFGKRGMEGKIAAISHARQYKIPFLGICLGLQMAVVEFARNVCDLNAFSAEMLDSESERENKEIVIDFMEGQKNISKKGGTMRLGSYECSIQKDSLAFELYQSTKVLERHRHRLEVQNQFVSNLESNGMRVSGVHNYTDNNGQPASLPEIIELDKALHPYFIGIQSHPEMLSRPTKPHPLFLGLIKASLK